MLESLLSEEISFYDKYRKWSQFPSGLKGVLKINERKYCLLRIISDYEWRNKLRYVRIFFDTPTFDKITKDRAAKFVDMLSAIGGTMGLLTGFSIISGVEILYFASKIIMSSLKKKSKI